MHREGSCDGSGKTRLSHDHRPQSLPSTKSSVKRQPKKGVRRVSQPVLEFNGDGIDDEEPEAFLQPGETDEMAYESIDVMEGRSVKDSSESSNCEETQSMCLTNVEYALLSAHVTN